MKNAEQKTSRENSFPSIEKPWLKYYKRPLLEKDIPDCSAYRMLYENNRNNLNDTALLYFNREITFRELFSKIETAAIALNRMGVKKGDIITLQVLNTPQTVILFYALSYIGAVANLVYITLSPKELKEILLNTNSRIYITFDSLWSKMKEGIDETSVEKTILLNAGEEADTFTKTAFAIKALRKARENILNWKSFLQLGTGKAAEFNQPELPVAMVYTSGTTGKSKAVVLTNKCFNALVLQYAGAYPSLERGGLFMNALPPFISFGLVCAMHMPLCLGIRNAIVLDPRPHNTHKYFIKYKPNYYVHGKMSLDTIINNKKIKKMNLSFIKVLATGGEPLEAGFEYKVNKFLAMHHADTKLSPGYGMTEVASTVVTATPDVNKPGTVGIPLPGTTVKIVEPGTTKELTYNTEGEICFNAPTMMQGYFNQDEETNNIKRKHSDGLMWIHSGDCGKISEDGFVTVSGRMKRMVFIIQDGIFHKFFPSTVEEKLMNVSGVSKIVVVTTGEEDFNKNNLVAFIVAESGFDRTKILNDLLTTANQNLESWERPVDYKFIDAVPLLESGKINYKKLELMVQEKSKKTHSR